MISKTSAETLPMHNKFTFSNIAWSPEEESIAKKLLVKYGVAGVEVAPARAVKDIYNFKNDEALAYRRYWNDEGISITSMQALLFGGPGGNIFGNSSERKLVETHLKKVIELASILGAKKLVFGSPKNRLKGELSKSEANASAADFFHSIAIHAVEHDTQLCIEPNPTYYGCDFVNTSDEAFELYGLINHSGFGVHLDAVGMHLSNEDINHQLNKLGEHISHFHISEKDLVEIGTGETPHNVVARALAKSKYSGYLSIEMLRQPLGIASVESALAFVLGHYND